MAAGTIAYASIPGWPSPAAGLFEACEAALATAGFSTVVSRAPDGLHVSDVATVNTAMAAYSGGAAQLAYAKAQKQAALDTLLDNNFDLKAFIRAGTASNIALGAVDAFLRAIANNYRSKRTSIAGAANVAAVTAIDVTAGWPANP